MASNKVNILIVDDVYLDVFVFHFVYLGGRRYEALASKFRPPICRSPTSLSTERATKDHTFADHRHPMSFLLPIATLNHELSKEKQQAMPQHINKKAKNINIITIMQTIVPKMDKIARHKCYVAERSKVK